MPEPSRTVHDGDFLVRQLHAWVQGGEVGVVPVGDHAAIDVGEDAAGDLDAPGLTPGRFTTGTTPADDGRELLQAVGGQVFRLQRLVGSAEVDCAGFDLLDAPARADRLIVQLVAGSRPYRLRPTSGRPAPGRWPRRPRGWPLWRATPTAAIVPHRRSQLRVSSTWCSPGPERPVPCRSRHTSLAVVVIAFVTPWRRRLVMELSS